MDIRKYGIAIAIAIVTAIFIYSVADAVAPQAEWEDCGGYPKYYAERGVPATNCSAVPADRAAEQACIDQEHNYQPVYDEYGCIESYECSACQKENQDRQERHSMVLFYVAVILGIVAIIVGFMLPLGSVHEWVGLGFIIGGVISMFIGTVQYWGELSRLARPIVIGLELAVLLFIIYRRMNIGQKKRR
jgi:hypothetical protein